MHPPLLCGLEQKRFVLSVHRTDRVGNGPEVWGTEVIATTVQVGAKQNAPDSDRVTERQSISPPQVLLNHRIEPQRFGRNGTAVPDHGFGLEYDSLPWQ